MEKKASVTENDLPPGVLRAVEQGKKIEAIKLLREATGLGLANAKVLVDKAAREHGPGNKARETKARQTKARQTKAREMAPRFIVEQTGLGRLLKMILLVVVAFSAYRYFSAS